MKPVPAATVTKQNLGLPYVPVLNAMEPVRFGPRSRPLLGDLLTSGPVRPAAARGQWLKRPAKSVMARGRFSGTGVSM